MLEAVRSGDRGLWSLAFQRHLCTQAGEHWKVTESVDVAPYATPSLLCCRLDFVTVS